MKKYLSKILRFFFINRKVKNKKIKTLLITLGIYIGVGICVGIVKGILGRIPLVGNVIYNIASLYTIYAWIGVILAAIQCFGKDAYSDVEYVTFGDIKKIKSLWDLRNGKIAIIVCLVLLCFVPNSGRKNKVKNNDINNENVTEIAMSNASETTETHGNEENREQNVEQQEELTEKFYSYVRGCYQGNELYYTFSRLENQYYYINSDSVGDKYTNENYHIAIYLVDKFECTDDSFEATLTENGNTHNIKGSLEDGKCTSLTFSDASKEIVLTNTSLTSYDELLAQDEYKNCYLSAYFNNESEDVYHSIEWFDYNKDDKFKSYRYDVSSETDGDELVLKYKESNCSKYIILGIKDGVVIPLYENLSFGNNEVYDEDTNTLWLYYDGGTSGGTGYYSLEYSPSRSSYHLKNSTTEIDERLEELKLIPIEEMKLYDRLIYELAQVEGFPDGYSSSIWDSMKFQFDGMTLEIGKTMYDEFLSSGNWEINQFGGFDRHNISYGTFDSSPDYVSFNEPLEHKNCSKTDKKNYNEYKKSSLDVYLKLYDVRDFSKDNKNKTIYSFEYDCFTYVPEEINDFPQFNLMGNITYNSTYEEVYEIYGTPTYVGRGLFDDGCTFIYISEDYTKWFSLSFDANGKLEKVNLIDYSWFQDKAKLEEAMKKSIVEGRADNYERLQERRSNRKNKL